MRAWTLGRASGGDRSRDAATVFLGLGLLSAIAAGWTAVRLVSRSRHEVAVVIAKTIVPPFAVVGVGDVAVTDIPVAAVPDGARRSLSAVVGQFTALGLAPGEIVTGTALLGGTPLASAYDERLAIQAGLPRCQAVSGSPQPTAGTSGTTALAPVCRNLVAMALPLSADQGFLLVRPGDRVDIFGTLGDGQGAVAQEVLHDVPVLACVPQGATGPAGSGWLVLALPATDALELELAQSSGKVDAVLRPPGVPPLPTTLPPVTLAGLPDQGNLPTQAGVLPSGVGG